MIQQWWCFGLQSHTTNLGSNNPISTIIFVAIHVHGASFPLWTTTFATLKTRQWFTQVVYKQSGFISSWWAVLLYCLDQLLIWQLCTRYLILFISKLLLPREVPCLWLSENATSGWLWLKCCCCVTKLPLLTVILTFTWLMTISLAFNMTRKENSERLCWM